MHRLGGHRQSFKAGDLEGLVTSRYRCRGSLPSGRSEAAAIAEGEVDTMHCSCRLGMARDVDQSRAGAVKFGDSLEHPE